MEISVKKKLNILWIAILIISSDLMAVKPMLKRPAVPYFPDIEGYQTLLCDLHTHSVFSDGLVWPTVRIDEAYCEGLDAISISDHIEYQPHKDDIPTQHNRSYEIAGVRAEEMGIMLVKAAEITRKTPPGHYNALFLEDVNPLVKDEFLGAIEQANQQHAFVFWNHHAWKGEEPGKWSEVQTTMVEHGWLHGMEVVNGDSYYPNAHRWCLDKNLAMLGNTDLHTSSFYYDYTPDNHRSLTLVFAREHSLESLQEALRAGRTAVWFKNQMIGQPEYLQKLYDASVMVSQVYHSKETERFFEMTNHSFLNLDLKRVGKIGPNFIWIPARSTVQISVNMPEGKSSQMMSYEVKNMLIEPEKGLPVQIEVSLP